MTCRGTSSEMLGSHGPGALRSKGWSCPGGASLQTGFSTPFLRSKMQGICERASSASTKNYLASRSGKISWTFAPKPSHRSAIRLPIYRSSSDLDWRTVILVLVLQNGHSTCKEYHHPHTGPQSPDIILIGLLKSGALVVAQNFSSQADTTT